MLNDSDLVFRSDSLYSALYIEAIKLGLERELHESAASGRIIFSDLLPYMGDRYMLPRPIYNVESGDESYKGSSERKKKLKKLKYIFSEDLQDYLRGCIDIDSYTGLSLGKSKREVKAEVPKNDDSRPYHVGKFYFDSNCGLYLTVGYEDEAAYDLLSEILISLSYTGIGGEKSSGAGRFEVLRGREDDLIMKALEKGSGDCMLISTALPAESELSEALDGAGYLLVKRSGFVYSDTFSEETRRKKDIFMFAAGSCFRHRWSGEIFEVGRGAPHPVYRYGRAMLMGI